MRTENKRFCKVCEKKIIVFTEIRSLGSRKIIENLFSNDGTLFKKAWFCRECFNLIINRKVNKEIFRRIINTKDSNLK